jgi:hypothetical protein
LDLFKQGDIEGAIGVLDKIINKLERYKNTATEAGNSYKQLDAMRGEMQNA